MSQQHISKVSNIERRPSEKTLLNYQWHNNQTNTLSKPKLNLKTPRMVKPRSERNLSNYEWNNNIQTKSQHKLTKHRSEKSLSNYEWHIHTSGLPRSPSKSQHSVSKPRSERSLANYQWNNQTNGLPKLPSESPLNQRRGTKSQHNLLRVSKSQLNLLPSSHNLLRASSPIGMVVTSRTTKSTTMSLPNATPDTTGDSTAQKNNKGSKRFKVKFAQFEPATGEVTYRRKPAVRMYDLVQDLNRSIRNNSTHSNKSEAKADDEEIPEAKGLLKLLSRPITKSSVLSKYKQVISSDFKTLSDNDRIFTNELNSSVKPTSFRRSAPSSQGTLRPTRSFGSLMPRVASRGTLRRQRALAAR